MWQGVVGQDSNMVIPCGIRNMQFSLTQIIKWYSWWDIWTCVSGIIPSEMYVEASLSAHNVEIRWAIISSWSYGLIIWKHWTKCSGHIDVGNIVWGCIWWLRLRGNLATCWTMTHIMPPQTPLSWGPVDQGLTNVQNINPFAGVKGLTSDWRRLQCKEIHDLNSSTNPVHVIKSRRMRWPGCVT